MSIGPVEYIAIAFPGNKFSGEIIPAIKELQESGTIRVLDLIIISKDSAGGVTAVELSEASPEEQAALAALGVQGRNLLGQEDVEDIGRENVWAARFAESLRNADGVLIANGRIPAVLVEEIMAESVS